VHCRIGAKNRKVSDAQFLEKKFVAPHAPQEAAEDRRPSSFRRGHDGSIRIEELMQDIAGSNEGIRKMRP
jgi:hypothetical protein